MPWGPCTMSGGRHSSPLQSQKYRFSHGVSFFVANLDIPTLFRSIDSYNNFLMSRLFFFSHNLIKLFCLKCLTMMSDHQQWLRKGLLFMHIGPYLHWRWNSHGRQSKSSVPRSGVCSVPSDRDLWCRMSHH